MNAKRALVAAAILTALMSLTPPVYAGDAPVTEDECRRGGGVVFTNANGRRECDGGTFEASLVV